MDTISNVPIMVNDTIEYLMKSDVVAFYSDLMDKQATQFNILIGVVSGIFVLALGATWWWNYIGAKQQIKEELESAKDSLSNIYKTHQNQTNEKVEGLIQEVFKRYVAEFQQQVNNIDSKNAKQLEQFQKETTNEIRSQKAELCRLFALYQETNGTLLNAITWWVDALYNYALTNNEIWVGISCDGLKDDLKRFDIKTINKNTKNHYDFTNDIETIEQYVPLTRSEDKKYIIQRLREIQSKIDE